MLLFPCLVAAAHANFRTAELQRLAAAIPLQVNDTATGYVHETVDGRAYVYHINRGMIDHVGLSLFRDDLKAMADTPILDFLERYFLQLLHPGDKSVEYLLRSDRVRFQRGSVRVIKQLCDSDAFSYSLEMGRYQARWMRDGKPLLVVSFPKDYQLILGVDKIEAEQLLESDLEAASAQDMPQPAIDPHLLVASKQPGFYTLLGNSYQISKINDNLYFAGDSLQGYRLVRDVSHPLESAADMMLSPYTDGEFTLCIDQALYGYRRKQFTVPLKNWIRFCASQGCHLYFGVEVSDGQHVKTSVFAVNDELGYAHVLVADIPMRVIDDGRGEIAARLDCYVPMQNVRNMFAKYHKNKRLSPRIYEQ